MAKCPKCGEDLIHLRYENRRIERGNFSAKEGYSADDYPQNDSLVFKCTECDENLFFEEKKAFDFLEGGE